MAPSGDESDLSEPHIIISTPFSITMEEGALEALEL